MVVFYESEAKLTLSQIEEIEIEIGFTFPFEYKQHLLKYNGGRCKPNVFSFIEKGKQTNSSIDWFLAIYDGKYDNFEDYYKTYKSDNKRLPNNLLPIAHDPGGNLICIDATNGKIYFWDHENEVDYKLHDDTNWSNLYLIAHGFEEFLDTLTEITD